MARYNQRNVNQAISIEHTAKGVFLDDGAEFRQFATDARPGAFPTRENIPNNMVGTGKAYPQQEAAGRSLPLNMPVAGLLHSTFGVRLFRDFLGGTIVETARGPQGTIDSAIRMLAAGSAPLMSNIVEKNGGRAFLHGDTFVQTFNVSQSGDAPARFDGTIQNSGYTKKLADTNIDVADVEAIDPYVFARGFKTTLSFSDGTTTFNAGDELDLVDVAFNGNQNVIVEGQIGDLPVDATNECLGSYARNLYIDVQTAVITFKSYMGDTFALFDSWAANKKLTNVTLIFYSCEKIGLTTDVWEFEIKLPVGSFNLAPDSQGNFDAYSATINAIEGDAVTGSLVLGRVRQVGSIDEVIP